MARLSLQAAYDQARQWLETNDLDRAVGMAEHILENHPSNLEAQRILGESFLASRQLDRSQASFERVLRSDPENIPAHVGLGITFERRGMLEQAISEFEQALEIKPDMPELRSQLLRLYTDAWGSENAQLRLSRAGLARLYAKGHMLPQAIAEFRQVLADQPERGDAQVALAESLWRNDQHEEAADLCRTILHANPDSLKANLILGFLELAAGSPEGEHAWQAAYAMDPYQAVARSLFTTLPPAPADEPSVPEWDEVAWMTRRAALVEEQEQIASTRPMEMAPADDDTDEMFAAIPVAASTGVAGARRGEEDDFLATLLALDTPPLAKPMPTPPNAEAQVVEADMPLDEIEMTPFSLADLGLSDDELAPVARPVDVPLPAASTPRQEDVQAPALADDDLDMTPFSLADLGLSDEEIAGLESIDDAPAPAAPALPAAPAAPPPPPPAVDEDDLEMTPFSLADLGLSDEEIASLEGVQDEPSAVPARVATPADDAIDLPADLQPFSIDELDLGVGTGREEIGELPSSLQPFSLEDSPVQPERPRMSGLVPDEPFETPPDEEEPLPGARGFSWQQPAQRAEPGFIQSMRTEPDPLDGSIFTKLKVRRNTSASLPASDPLPPTPLAVDEHMGLFSLDDVSLREDEEAAAIAAASALVVPALPEEPADRLLESESIEEALAMGEIQPFSFADLGLSDEEIAALGLAEAQPAAPVAQTPPVPASPPLVFEAPPAAPPPTAVAPATPAPPTDEIESIEEALATGEIQPFSFADLGLSDEEIAALGLAEEVQAPQPASSPTPADPPLASTDEIESIEESLAAGEIQPFSFADLGLSDEEIVALEEPDDTPAAAVAPPAASPPPAEMPESIEEALAAGEIQPFSFADLGLSDEEIAALGLAEPQTGSPPADAAAGNPLADRDHGRNETTPVVPEPAEEPLTGDLQPFSLADLGLSDDELGDLGMLNDNGLEIDDSKLGLTEDELAGIARGGDVDLSETFDPPSSDATPLDSLAVDNDQAVERLIALGQQQGFVDIADIIAAVENPEAEAERIEQIGQQLHAANIQIRDGDEVIDMDAEYAEEEYLDAQAYEPPSAVIAGEVIEPFSLAELGLSDEEIAMLGLGEATEPTTTPPSLPPVTPESFSLGLGGATDPLDLAEPDPPAPLAAEQADLEPFSLAELGLTDEEIAMLGLTEATNVPPAAPAVPPALPERVMPPEPVMPTTPPPECATPPAPIKQVLPVPPLAPVVPTTVPTPPTAPAPLPQRESSSTNRSRGPVATGNNVLDDYLRQLDTDPHNHILRLSIARVGGQIGMNDLAVQQYRDLIKRGVLLDEVIADIGDLIGDSDDEPFLKRLHRALGDAYSKQGRFREAVEEYSWTLGGSRVSH